MTTYQFIKLSLNSWPKQMKIYFKLRYISSLVWPLTIFITIN